MYRENDFFVNSGNISLLSGFQALFVLEPYESKKSSFCHRLKLTHGNFEQVRRLTDVMLEEYKRQSSGWRTLMKSYFLQLAVMLPRLYEFDENSLNTDIINLAKAVAYIETHYAERHFLRLFRKKTGLSPTEYRKLQ